MGEEKPGEVEKCSVCRGERKIQIDNGFGSWQACYACKGTGRQPAAPAEPARRGLQTNGPSPEVRMRRQIAELEAALAASKAREGELEKQLEAYGREIARQEKRIDKLRQDNSAMDCDLNHHRRDYRELRENELLHLTQLSAAQAEIARLTAERGEWKRKAEGTAEALADLRSFDAKAGPYEAALEEISRLRGLLAELSRRAVKPDGRCWLRCAECSYVWTAPGWREATPEKHAGGCVVGLARSALAEKESGDAGR